MKLHVWLLFALAPLTAVMVLAQDTTPAPAASPAAPAPESIPAAPKEKASSVKKRVVLEPPAPALVKGTNVNVRAQASFAGETLGRLQEGDAVTVVEQITLSRPKVSEPAEWARIVVPPGIAVWVNADYIDAATKTIKARRVNLRGGPGENYSQVGRLPKGAAIKEIKTEKGWVAIEAPTNAYAYVAAEFLALQPPPAPTVTPPPAAPPPAAPAPEPTAVIAPVPAPPAATSEPAVAAPQAPAPSSPSEVEQELAALHQATAPEPAPGPAPTLVSEPAATPAPAPPPVNEPVTPRVVTREGFVRRAYSVQAPTDFELHDIQDGRLIEYLKPKPGQNFKIFLGTRVSVTGPEALDSRWPRTPVLQVQSVDLLP